MFFKIFKYILTPKCNFRCYYCYQWAKKSNWYSTLKEFTEVIAILKNKGVKFEMLYFYWWEPFLNKDFIKWFITWYSREWFRAYFWTRDFTIITNATYLKFLFEDLIDWWFNITVSIDSIKNDINYKLGRYSNLKDIFYVFLNLKRQRKLHFLNVNITLTPYNIQYLIDMIKFLVEILWLTINQIDVDIAYNVKWEDNDIEIFKNTVSILMDKWYVRKEMFYNEIAWPIWSSCYKHMSDILTVYKNRIIWCSYFLDKEKFSKDICVLDRIDYQTLIKKELFNGRNLRYRLCENDFIYKQKLLFSEIFKEIFSSWIKK